MAAPPPRSSRPDPRHIRAPALAVEHRSGWQRPWVKPPPSAPRRPVLGTPLTFRTTPRALLRTTARTDLRALTASTPARLGAGVALAATIGSLAATAPWATAASTADAAHATAATTAASGPTTIYDSTNPSAIPAGQHVATYSDGAFQAPASSVAGRGNVLWIDTNGTNTHASALDVEPGDATPAGAAHWVNAKLTASPRTDAIVYTFKSDWSSVQHQINNLPTWEQAHVKYWIADPTGTPHNVPGAAATQWYWGTNYDITQATPGFFS